ncbi:hypothetical protein NDU88_002924 [Pleurodeles waltl]|uniref:Uncharacterized protein n=1 Tax=Pleurodeles waltl TaxID=8319 RepID=A0AAV7LH35_PLEWA|nr:hypothetical protein NDU88_002924 [Pleurodeles waltl]
MVVGVGVVTARKRGVVVGVLVMEVVDDDVVHAGVSGDETGREEGDEEEGDTVEAVAVGLVDSLHAVLLHRARPLGQVLFLQEEGPDGGIVAAVEPVDSEDEEAEEEDIDNRNTVIQQYFQ